MAYPKQYPEKPLVLPRAFAQDRDMLELPLVDVLEAFENEIEPCSKLGYTVSEDVPKDFYFDHS